MLINQQYCQQYCWLFNNIASNIGFFLLTNTVGIIADNIASNINDLAFLLPILSPILLIIQQYCWQYCWLYSNIAGNIDSNIANNIEPGHTLATHSSLTLDWPLMYITIGYYSPKSLYFWLTSDKHQYLNIQPYINLTTFSCI